MLTKLIILENVLLAKLVPKAKNANPTINRMFCRLKVIAVCSTEDGAYSEADANKISWLIIIEMKPIRSDRVLAI